MASVNDLAKQYEQDCEARDNCEPYRARGLTCPECPAREAEDIRDIAREAWKPAETDPPTKDDADHFGMVLVVGVNGRVTTEKWHAVQPFLLNVQACKWARTRDVILLPEGEGE